MSRIINYFVTFSAFVLLTLSTSAQIFVDTTLQFRNVVLETYNGINCRYCPDGDRVADTVAAAHPGRVFVINIHQGPFATQYTTQWGDSLAEQAGVDAYPYGTINRHLFAGQTKTAIYRDKWALYANHILETPSPVNIAARAVIDLDTRELEVTVQLYYTAAQTVNVNVLNVALLQDNVIGPQSGASQWYPEMMTTDGLYRHNHLLRHLLTGQWGDTVPNITPGQCRTWRTTYTIPESICDGASLPNLRVVAFVAEGHQEIITGCEAKMVLSKASILSFETDASDCHVRPFVTLIAGSDTITSLRLKLGDSVLTHPGIVLPGEIDTIFLPEIPLPNPTDTPGRLTRVDTVALLNYTTIDGATVTVDNIKLTATMYDFYAANIDSVASLTLGLDQYGSETTLDIMKIGDCSEVYTAGPFTNDQHSSVRRKIDFDLSPADTGLYLLTIRDSYGEGMSATPDTTPAIVITTAGGSAILSHSGDFASKVSYLLRFVTHGDGFVGKMITINAFSSDTTMGVVTGGGKYREGDSVILVATPVAHHHFVAWSDGATENTRNMIATENISLTAMFAVDSFIVSAHADSCGHGEVFGGGRFPYGSIVTLVAEPDEGCRFVRWSNGQRVNPYTFAVRRDAEITATFAVGEPDTNLVIYDTVTIYDTIHVVVYDTVTIYDTVTVALDTVGASADIRLYVVDDRIVVEGAHGRQVQLFDGVGRLLRTGRDDRGRLAFNVPVSGTYIVRVEGFAAKRIVILR